MSFYGSAPTQNSSAPQQQRQNHSNPNAWPANAFDQFLFQDSDLPVNPMGGLRRPPNPQPPPNPQNFSLVDTVGPEFASFPTDQVDNERLMLEASRLEFEALQRRPTPNPTQLEQVQKAVRSQPQPTPAYRNLGERNIVPGSSCNASLPPEAYDIAADISLDPSAEILTSRGKDIRKIGLGPYVQQLINFNREQQRGTKDHSLENFWKPLIASYFAPDANLHIDLKSTNSNEHRPIRVPVEALPRIWKSKLEAGVNAERTLLENPCEFLSPSGVVVVDCPKTVILTTYQNSVVQTDGHLRVTFHRNKKIAMWEFCSQKHEELYTKKGLTAGSKPAIPPSACSEFGIPAPVVRLMMIANDVNDLADKIGAEIAKLAAKPERISPLPNAPAPNEEKQAGPGAQAPFSALPSNGNAYRALSSMLDGPQPEQNVRGANINLPAGRPGAGTTARGITEELDVDLKKAIENDASLDPTIRDAITSWRADPALMFPNIVDEALRAPFIGAGREDVDKNTARNQLDMKMPGRHPTSGLKRAQSAIEAVAAAASGQGGWGMGTGGQRDLATRAMMSEELDPSLQLLSTATDANLTLRNANDNALRGSAARQGGAPPGLSLFTPQSTDLDRNNVIGRRERAGRGAGMRAMGSAGRRAGGGAQTIKGLEGLRAFQQMSAKGKRERANQNVQEGVAGSTHGDFATGAQGVVEQNGGLRHVKSGGRSDGGKGGKDRTSTTSGARRSAHRSPPTDERMEKRQKTSNPEAR